MEQGKVQLHAVILVLQKDQGVVVILAHQEDQGIAVILALQEDQGVDQQTVQTGVFHHSHKEVDQGQNKAIEVGQALLKVEVVENKNETAPEEPMEITQEEGDPPVAEEEEEDVSYNLKILPLTFGLHQKHGLRHSDYQRYRGYCSRRIARVRKATKMVQVNFKRNFGCILGTYKIH